MNRDGVVELLENLGVKVESFVPEGIRFFVPDGAREREADVSRHSSALFKWNSSTGWSHGSRRDAIEETLLDVLEPVKQGECIGLATAIDK